MILRPGEFFTISRVLERHADTSTYFVRAVIRNARTQELLDTVDLTDNTGQNFTAEWQVPGDPSGQGVYIQVVTTVYTDSGYTTKSPIYGQSGDTYLIDDRITRQHGGGSGVDLMEVREVVKEAFGKLVIPPVEAPVVKVPKIKIPKPQKVNLKPLMERIDKLSEAISNIPVAEKVDLSDLSEDIGKVLKAIETQERTSDTMLSAVKAFVRGDGKRELAQILKALKVIQKKIQNSPVVIVDKAEPVEKESFDTRRLTG